MAKKKSRRHRGPRPVAREAAASQPEQAQAPVQSAVTTPPPSGAIAPKAAPVRPAGHPSHNLALELRMIAILGGGAVIILAILSMFQPTTHVANWLHL